MLEYYLMSNSQTKDFLSSLFFFLSKFLLFWHQGMFFLHSRQLFSLWSLRDKIHWGGKLYNFPIYCWLNSNINILLFGAMKIQATTTERLQFCWKKNPSICQKSDLSDFGGQCRIVKDYPCGWWTNWDKYRLISLLLKSLTNIFCWPAIPILAG